MKKSNIIKEFAQFKKINEGGGAGISFDLKGNTVTVSFTLKDGKVEDVTKKLELGDSFDAKGYDDGMTNVATENMFVYNLDSINVEKVINTKIEHELLHDLDLTQDDAEDVEEISKSLYEISKENSAETYNITLSVSFDYKTMLFWGWVRGQINEGDTIFGSDNVDNVEVELSCNGEYSDLYIYSNEKGSREEFEEQMIPSLQATERMHYFYDSVFTHDIEDDIEYDMLRDEYGFRSN